MYHSCLPVESSWPTDFFLCLIPFFSSTVRFENNENYFQGFFRRQGIFFLTLSLLSAEILLFLGTGEGKITRAQLRPLRDVTSKPRVVPPCGILYICMHGYLIYIGTVLYSVV